MTAITMRAGQMADEVRAEAKRLDPAKTLLTLLFVIPFVLGWLVGAIWTACAWAWTAGLVGYRTAVRRDAGSD